MKIGVTIIKSWNFHNPVKVNFGAGILEKISEIAGNNVLLVTTPGFTKRGLTNRAVDLLAGKEVKVYDYVLPNPEVERVDNDFKELSGNGIDVVVGIGGGSVLDTAKAFTYLLSLGEPLSLQQAFEDKVALPAVEMLPMIAVPTTSGTGSEVTPFATLWDAKQLKKYSLATPKLYSDTALLDPELTLGLPREITIDSGLDVLSHALESLWSKHVNPLSRLYALQAVEIVMQTLPELINYPGKLALRSEMMQASLLAGLAISSTRTALAHSMSYPVTAKFGVPHGLACAFCLPELLEFNAEADDGRLKRVALKLGFDSIASMQTALVKLFAKVEVDQSMRSYISSLDELVALAPEMHTPGRADNNIRSADQNDIRMLLEKAFQRSG